MINKYLIPLDVDVKFKTLSLSQLATLTFFQTLKFYEFLAFTILKEMLWKIASTHSTLPNKKPG